VGIDKDKLREEVRRFIAEYDQLDNEALEQLLVRFIVKPYPTKEGQDG
jgi:hypothetical protein